MSTDSATSEQADEAVGAGAANKEAVALTDPLLMAFDAGGRSSLSRFSKANFDRALGAYLPSLLAPPSEPRLREKLLALQAASPACALPYEFTLLFSASERRSVCDHRAAVCLDYYLERFAPSFRDLPTTVYLGDCGLCCCERILIRDRPCCRFPVCTGCCAICVRLALSEGRPRVVCPGCHVEMRRGELSLLYLQGDAALMRRHEQLLADHTRDPGVKTCPACGYVCRRNADLVKSAPDVVCETCGHPWCFACHGPCHPDRPCLDTADPDLRLLTAWSRQMRAGDDEDGEGAAVGGGETRTARACPECSALIERNGGCPQVTCTLCRTEFCYLCGKKYKQDGRYLGLVPKRLLGDHDSPFSVFGCSANLLPNQPRLRRAVRRGALALAIGGAAVGGLAASPLLLLASPVWAPLLAAREARRRRRRVLEESEGRSYQDSASQEYKSYEDSASQEDKSYQG